MKKTIKAIALDMDGTLLTPDQVISEQTKQSLLFLQQQGVKVILASGRSWTRLMPYAKQLKMDQYGGYLIEVDGVALYDFHHNKREKLRTMSPQEIYVVLEWLIQEQIECHAVFDDGLFAFIPDWTKELKQPIRAQISDDPDFPWTAGPWGWVADLRDGYPKQTYIQSAKEVNQEINKIQIMNTEENVERIYHQLKEIFGNQFSIYRTTPRQLEVLPLGYSKGKALKVLMSQHGWTPQDVIAFGDGENDIPMFEVVEYSYAMGNARFYVQQAAQGVCPPNDQDGIAKTLQTFIDSV